MRITTAATLLVLSVAPIAGAQSIRVAPRAEAYTVVGAQDPNRAMLGISTSPSGRRDTLGLLITSVTAGSPAEKAGLEEGNRLISINGVNLKLSRDDAGDDDMQGVNQNRLTREMRKVKAGEEVALEVWASGRGRSVKVKTVSADDLSPRRTATMTTRDDERMALGLFLSSTGSKRDTAGVFVQQVVEGGPAEKAGITEGDRIASINGVDLRVPREDAGDWSMGSSRIDRLEREVRKLKAGESADLAVVSGGRSRTVKVVAVRARDLPGGEGFSYRSGGNGVFRFQGRGAGGVFTGPNGTVRVMPRIRIGGGVDYERPGDYDRSQIEERLRGLRGLEGLEGKLRSLEGLKSIDGMRFYDDGRSFKRFEDIDPDVRIRIEDKLNRQLPEAMDKIRDVLKDKRVIPSKFELKNRIELKDRIVIPSKVQIKPISRIIL